MPGNTPAEAVEAFLAPLRLALSVIAQAKITVRRGGLNPPLDTEQQWSLNNGASVVLRRGTVRDQPPLPAPLKFHAHMYWRAIQDEREGYGPYRVSTLGYEYAMLSGDDDTEVWAMHWHPSGRSDEIKPHLHFGPAEVSHS